MRDNIMNSVRWNKTITTHHFNKSFLFGILMLNKIWNYVLIAAISICWTIEHLTISLGKFPFLFQCHVMRFDKSNWNIKIPEIIMITRLLGLLQPQKYPPVALNQYTWVNRTHRYFKYICICFKAPQPSYNRFHTKAILSTTCKIWK